MCVYLCVRERGTKDVIVCVRERERRPAQPRSPQPVPAPPVIVSGHHPLPYTLHPTPVCPARSLVQPRLNPGKVSIVTQAAGTRCSAWKETLCARRFLVILLNREQNSRDRLGQCPPHLSGVRVHVQPLKKVKTRRIGEPNEADTMLWGFRAPPGPPWRLVSYCRTTGASG